MVLSLLRFKPLQPAMHHSRGRACARAQRRGALAGAPCIVGTDMSAHGCGRRPALFTASHTCVKTCLLGVQRAMAPAPWATADALPAATTGPRSVAVSPGAPGPSGKTGMPAERARSPPSVFSPKPWRERGLPLISPPLPLKPRETARPALVEGRRGVGERAPSLAQKNGPPGARWGQEGPLGACQEALIEQQGARCADRHQC